MIRQTIISNFVYGRTIFALFTFKDNVDTSYAKNYFRNFLKRRNTVLSDKYLYVIEGGDKRVHIHSVFFYCDILPDTSWLDLHLLSPEEKSYWREYASAIEREFKGGFVKVKPVTKTPAQVAMYLSKYLSKDVKCCFRPMGYSKNLIKPEISYSEILSPIPDIGIQQIFSSSGINTGKYEKILRRLR